MKDLDSLASRLEAALTGRPADHDPADRGGRQAAVAIILHDDGDAGDSGPQLLFIKRAHKPGDPWSGQMAFPGGHRDPEDADLLDAAIRETAEEIGLDLRAARYLGAIDAQRAAPRGRPTNLLIAPHVFVQREIGELNPNYEVAEVVSAPLQALMSNRLHHVETYDFSGAPTPYNGYLLPSGHFVWGLTYRMLKAFFQTLDAAWRPPRER